MVVRHAQVVVDVGGSSSIGQQMYSLGNISRPQDLWPGVRNRIPDKVRLSGREEEMVCMLLDGSRRVITDAEWTELAEILGWNLSNVEEPGKGVICPETGFAFMPEAGGSSIEAVFNPVLSTRYAQLIFLRTLLKIVPWTEKNEIYVVRYSAQLLDVAVGGLDESKGIKRYLILNEYFKNALASLARFCDIASHQSQVCVGYDEFLEVLNMGFFSAVFVGLGANCPDDEQNAFRLDIWDLLDEANPDAENRCGIAPMFSDWESFRDWICSLDAIMILQGDDYVATDKTFGELRFRSLEDLRNALAGFFTSVWTHFRLKMPADGILTVESRPVGQQPFDGGGEAFAALQMGLTVNHKKVTAYRKEIAERLGMVHDSKEFTDLARDWLRTAQIDGPHGAKFNGSKVLSREMFKKILELAREGLLLRGMGEEVALVVLEQRLESGVIPAMITRQQRQEGGATNVVARNCLRSNVEWMEEEILSIELAILFPAV